MTASVVDIRPVITRDDRIALPDGRIAIVSESYETLPGRRWLTACPVGAVEEWETAVYVLASECRRLP